MHEVSVAAAIVSTVREALPGRTVEAVEVVVGALSGVVPQALEFAWEVVTADTPLQGALLVVDWVPTTVYCPECEATVTPEVGFLCPRCGGLSGDLRTGRELEVRSVRVRDDQVVDV